MSLPITTKPGRNVLYGWRGFFVYNPSFLTTTQTVWVPGEKTEAVCRVGKDHLAPDLKCDCGVYAFSEPTQLQSQGYLGQSVYAKVALWGRVVECEKGFRAQYAYPVHLYAATLTPASQLRELAYIAHRYGCGFEIKDIWIDPVQEAKNRELQRLKDEEMQKLLLERGMRKKKQIRLDYDLIESLRSDR